MLKYKILSSMITLGNPITDLVNAIDNAGTDIQTLIKAAAQVASGLVGAVCGLILLITCIKAGWKSHKGNDGAWDEASGTIANCVIILAIAGAVFTAFF